MQQSQVIDLVEYKYSRVPHAIIKAPNLNPNERCLLMFLCGQMSFKNTNWDEQRWESVNTLAKALCISSRTVIRTKNSLAKKGYLIAQKRNPNTIDPKKAFVPKNGRGSDFLSISRNLFNDYKIFCLGTNCQESTEKMAGAPRDQMAYKLKLNSKTKINLNKTTSESSSKKIDSIISYFQKKLPKAQIHLDKFRNKLKYSSLSEEELLERIDIIVNSPVLTYQCKSINFIFTLENKSSIGYKKESEYLEVQKIEINFLKTNDELQTKLNEMATYLSCSRETLDQYLISKGFDLNKPEFVEEETKEIAEPIEPANNFLDLETFEVKKESPNKSEIPNDPNFKAEKQSSFKGSTRKNMEKTLLNLAKKTPDKKEKVESFFSLLEITGKINPALEASYKRIIAA